MAGDRSKPLAPREPKPRRIVDRAAVAVYLAVSPATVKYLADSRQIPFVWVGRFIRYDLDDIDRWLDEHKAEVAS